MNILLANDDGIKAEGIHRLAAALRTRGDVYVFAPDQQRSASSHGMQMHTPIGVRLVSSVEFPEAKKAWAVSGLPTDCVKLGMEILKSEGIRPDILYAGINHGPNLGTDVMYSGTVSAAAEGIIYDLPAVAVSVCSHAPRYFETACTLAEAVFDRALSTVGRGVIVSINTPDLPADQIKGVRPACLGIMRYAETFDVLTPEEVQQRYPTLLHPGTTADEMRFYHYSGAPINMSQPPNADVQYIAEGFATISMVRYNFNDATEMKKLETWEIMK